MFSQPPCKRSFDLPEFTQDQLNLKPYYVYVLMDPRTDEVFYVGKGTEQRVYNHVTEALDGKESNESDKLKQIEAIFDAGESVRELILARYESEESAFMAEALLMHYAYEIDKLTNIQPAKKRYQNSILNRLVNTDEPFQIESSEGQYYVYSLSDPRTGNVFYIGKGLGDRVKAHVKEAGMSSAENNKLETIRAIEKSGLSVEQRIIAIYENEETAFEMESLLINWVYGLNQLTNAVSGHGGNEIRTAGYFGKLPKVDAPDLGYVGLRELNIERYGTVDIAYDLRNQFVDSCVKEQFVRLPEVYGSVTCIAFQVPLLHVIKKNESGLVEYEFDVNFVIQIAENGKNYVTNLIPSDRSKKINRERFIRMFQIISPEKEAKDSKNGHEFIRNNGDYAKLSDLWIGRGQSHSVKSIDTLELLLKEAMAYFKGAGFEFGKTKPFRNDKTYFGRILCKLTD